MTAGGVLHLGLHVLVPALAARWLGGSAWFRAYLLLQVGWLIDLDHLMASPVFDPNRCSLGLHPLHTAPAALAYTLLVLPRPTRLVGAGLLIHLALDGVDCLRMG